MPSHPSSTVCKCKKTPKNKKKVLSVRDIDCTLKYFFFFFKCSKYTCFSAPTVTGCKVEHLVESVSVLVILVRWRLLEEGTEGRAHGATLQGLLHTEIVHHALLNLLLGRGEQKASEDSQLGGDKRQNVHI